MSFDPGCISFEEILVSLCDLGHTPVADECAPQAPAKDSGDLVCQIGVNLAKVALRQMLKGSATALILELF